MTATYDCIATTTANGSVSDISFTSISGSYTDLILVIAAKVGSGSYNIRWRVNSDTGTNYSYTTLSGTGSSASSSKYNNQSSPFLNDYGYLDTTWANMIAHFMNYSNTTTYKTVVSRSNNANNGTAAVVGLWRSTSAITSIDLTCIFGATTANFSAGSTFTLYGIKAA